MTKPTLLICPGIPKTGTTTIAQHLQDSKYFHYGLAKEFVYLPLIYSKQNDSRLDHLCKSKEFRATIQNKFYTTYKSFTKCNSFLYEFSIENYINFYLELAEYTSMIPMDFTQHTHKLPQQFLQECYDQLSQHFNIKILLSYRDPIKRLFSHANMEHITNSSWMRPNSNRYPAKHFFYNDLTKKHIHNLYTDTYSIFNNIFGKENVTHIIYEKYFDSSNDSERKKLFRFLNIPYQTIEISKKYNEGKYKETLTQEDITFAKDKMKDAYTLWQEVIGELPNEWI
jgi:hypothetical protein